MGRRKGDWKCGKCQRMNWYGDNSCKYCGYEKWSERCPVWNKDGNQCEDVRYHSGRHWVSEIRKYFDEDNT